MRFQDALDRKGEEIERPPLPPTGTYLWRVSKLPELGSVANGRYETVDFTLTCLQPSDDVDADQLSEYIEKAGNIAGLVRRHRFMFDTEDEGKFRSSEFRMKQFVENHLQVSMEGKTWKETFAEVVNTQCLASLRWRPDPNDAEILYAEIDRTAPAD